MSLYCPDCTWTPVSARRRGKDGRCDYCRSQYIDRRHRARPASNAKRSPHLGEVAL